MRIFELPRWISTVFCCRKGRYGKGRSKSTGDRAVRGDLRIARIRTIQKGKEVLTADQRKKLQELLAEQIAGL